MISSFFWYKIKSVKLMFTATIMVLWMHFCPWSVINVNDVIQNKWLIAVFMSFDPSIIIIIIISCFYFIVWKNIESRVRLYKIGLNQFVYGAKFFEWKIRKQYRNVVSGSLMCRYRLSCGSACILYKKKTKYISTLYKSLKYKAQ